MPFSLLAPLTLALLQAAPAAPASPAAAPVIAPPPAPATEPEATPTPPAAAPVAAPVVAPPAPATSTPPPTWYLPNAAPVPVTTVSNEGPSETPDLDAIKYRRLVFSNFYTLNFGIFPIPSGDFSFFLGTNLRPRKSSFGKDWNTALGYQLTLSVGGADIAFAESDAVGNNNNEFDFFGPIFFHRHTLMAQGLGGRKGRLYYAMGAGAVMWRTVLAGVEGEGKLGYAFAAREGSRAKGIVGGQIRLGGAFDGLILPQFGLFLGFMVF